MSSIAPIFAKSYKKKFVFGIIQQTLFNTNEHYLQGTVQKVKFSNSRINHGKKLINNAKSYSSVAIENSENTLDNKDKDNKYLTINGTAYKKDGFTNITPKILSYVNKNIYLQEYHPLSLIRQEVINYFYKFRNHRGNPMFSIHDNLNCVVTVEQNYDSLLVPKSHPSRSKSDCYYVNEGSLLRAHMTAHQADLIKSGLDNFLMIGDVYRRDEIDSTHFPVFHQIDAVRLKSRDELFQNNNGLEIFESDRSRNNTIENYKKQSCHTLEAVKLMEHDLKLTLENLAKHLYTSDIETRWVDVHFPFTEPSWELEILLEGKWTEVLGCGIMRNEILENNGVYNSIGWAFGIGLERLAMFRYNIPDIRLFWSNDSGFLNQFHGCKPSDRRLYKKVSSYPQCTNDISFWLPQDNAQDFSPNDFYDLVRTIGGDIVEQVTLQDEFKHPKTGRTSHCYRIVYRHMERTLTQKEVNEIHQQIENQATATLAVLIR